MANETIVIDDNLRTMTIPSSITLLGVESDDDVNKIPFQMPKEYCGFDLSTFEARINYMNPNGDGDIYIVQDLEVDGDDPSLMDFTWLVGRNACAYKGNTQFIVCLKKFDSNQNVIQEFNTTVYSLPVLQGLETTDAVVQQNADIIEYILQQIEEAGSLDFSNYYTKAETEALLPTELPNPQPITINGVSYDGSEEVVLTIETDIEETVTASGKIIHVTDAVPQAVKSLQLYDSNSDPISSASISIANKNLFRIDLLPTTTVSKGITFTKNDDGSISASGTSTGTYAMTSCSLNTYMFVVGKTYTISSGKTSGLLYVQLIMNYADSTTDYLVARNSSTTFTLQKAVNSCTASVQITDSGVTLSGETIYPMLELANSASAFENNTYTQMSYDGTSMPVLPALTSNLWANTNTVANIEMEYANDLNAKTDAIQEDLNAIRKVNTVYATHDGAGTVTLNVG